MPEPVSLTSAADAFSVPAFRWAAEGGRRAGIVVLQEIFGVSDHIRGVAGRFAQAGYEAIAPTMFARIDPDFSATLDAEGVAKGRAAASATPWPQVVADVQAAIDALAPPVFVVGFCWGGAAAWAAAQHGLGLAAAACFYGRAINLLLDAPPRVPTLLHYGLEDASIPPEMVAAVREAYPDVQLHLYSAGHGFCREGSAEYNAEAANLAFRRTFDFFDLHGAAKP